MASPDHAATIKEATDHIARGCRGTGSHDPSVYLFKIDASLDALVAALAQAEHERDEAKADRNRVGDAARELVRDTLLQKERAERQRDQAIEALREITETRAGAVTADLMLEIARDVLANIEKDTA